MADYVLVAFDAVAGGFEFERIVMSEPEDIAGLVAWLLTPDARGVTGQGLDMNGGAFMI